MIFSLWVGQRKNFSSVGKIYATVSEIWSKSISYGTSYFRVLRRWELCFSLSWKRFPRVIWAIWESYHFWRNDNLWCGIRNRSSFWLREWPQWNHIHCGHNFTHPTLPAHPVLLLGNRNITFRSLVVYLVVSKTCTAISCDKFPENWRFRRLDQLECRGRRKVF